MSISVPPNLEALDYAALDKIEGYVKTLKAKLYQEAQERARTMLDKMGASVGAKFEFVPTQVPTNGNGQHKAVKAKGRKAAKIAVKFRDPANPQNTWSGRGRQARWLAAFLKQGRKIEEFTVGR